MYMNDGNKTEINLRNKSVFITGVAGFIGSKRDSGHKKQSEVCSIPVHKVIIIAWKLSYIS